MARQLNIQETLELLLSRASLDADGCLVYTYGEDLTGGYGNFAIVRPTGCMKAPWGISAHRASWYLQIGPIPDKLHVLHHCDKRRCILLEDLFLGTPKDNTQDMISKGRSGRDKLVRIPDSIIERWLQGESSVDLAEEVGCHRNAISWAFRNRYRRTSRDTYANYTWKEKNDINTEIP
jgi:hypothetical protein